MNFLFHLTSLITFLVLAIMDPRSSLYCLETMYGQCQKWWLWTPNGDLNIPPRPRLVSQTGCD